MDLGTETVPGSLLSDVDVVFHLAGIAHQRAEPSQYERVNHRATLELAAAAAAAGVKTFVFLSSVKAMGPPQSDAERTESDGQPAVDPYGRSKAQAEQDLISAYSDSDMSVIILRPALVYGAGARGNLQLLAKAVRAGVPRPPERGGRSMISLKDLTSLLYRLALESPEGVHTWIVCDDNHYSACGIHDLMRAALGKGPALSWIPLAGWRLVCALRDVLARPADGSTFEKVFGTEQYSAAALKRDMNWAPATTLADIAGDIMSAESQTARSGR